MGQQESKAAAPTTRGGDRNVVEPPGQCKRLACDVQECLAQNNYQQDRCKKDIDALNKCMQDYQAYIKQQQQQQPPQQEASSSSATRV